MRNWRYVIIIGVVAFLINMVDRVHGCGIGESPFFFCNADSVGLQQVSVDRDLLEYVPVRGRAVHYAWVRVNYDVSVARGGGR